MQKLKAVLFDLDGTLIDSEYFHFECWNDILKESSHSMTYPEWLKNYAGFPLPSNSKNIKERYGLDISLADLVHKREQASVNGLENKTINLMPFAMEMLRFFKQEGLKMGLVTASPRFEVDLIFKKNGMAAYFDVIITRTDVERPKPDPEGYNLCVEKLGVDKVDCIVFEDTLNGLNAAKAAGLTCYVVQSDQDQHDKLLHADAIFRDLKAAGKFAWEN
ncbi:HAD family hydrolase [Pedobacter nutrimenti]|jgi:HAD superfamily hydrolase (TIGR01509 family)|uniref:HAD superfamily hydrolase (TIGR01509 family)/HAD superfamily hydrolase (TIGR01549 family) n=1 Tax=Pedobacter nutrimenti TaxID=1241337 RepID=A0A318UP21_9SPHI|nr:HAD family phosphatase [Pedobacter nutrimenti]PYF76848.1 HAD superfamily hydrolase (TIGR01509 family)/HAD superfamily hydrolase (TIGR01549 family) [Pedobacter nutrimenti]